MAGTDFVTVQLSAAGVKMADAGGRVAVSNGRRDFEFKAGVPQLVLKAYEWSHVLSQTFYGGECIFEIVPDAPVTSGQNQTAAAPPAHEG